MCDTRTEHLVADDPSLTSSLPISVAPTATSLQPPQCSNFDAVQRVLWIFNAASSLPLLQCGYFEVVHRAIDQLAFSISLLLSVIYYMIILLFVLLIWADSANNTGASGSSQSRPRRVSSCEHSPHGASTRRRPQLDFALPASQFNLSSVTSQSPVSQCSVASDHHDGKPCLISLLQALAHGQAVEQLKIAYHAIGVLSASSGN